MVTEKGSITCTTVCDKKYYRQTIFKFMRVAVAVISVGVALMLIYALLLVAWACGKMKYTPAMYAIPALLIIIAGLGFLLYLLRIVRKYAKHKFTVEYEFFNNYMFYAEYLNGVENRVKIFYYCNILEARETRDNILYCTARYTWFGINKKELTEGELNALRKLFDLKVSGGENVTLAEGKEYN
ncbi:MAG: hypothetical protein K2O67_03105 [Clostridia bacterium]|nr:hypothetical protein [Clostridia bacterium]